MIHNYATIKYQEENFVEAQSCYNELLLCKKSNIGVLSDVPDYDIAYHLAILSYQCKDYDSAINMFSIFLKDEVRSNQKDASYHLSEVHLMLAEMYEKRNFTTETNDQAISHYTKFIEYKEPTLLLQFRKNSCGAFYVDSKIVEALTRLGELNFRAEHFLDAEIVHSELSMR